MFIPATMTALRTRRCTSTWYIRPTIHRLNFQPIDGRGRSSLQPPNASGYPPARSTLPPPFIPSFVSLDVRRAVVSCRGLLPQFSRGSGVLRGSPLIQGRVGVQPRWPSGNKMGGSNEPPTPAIFLARPWMLGHLLWG